MDHLHHPPTPAVSTTAESSRTERLEHENEQLRRMLDLAPGGIIVHDQEGRILYANRFASVLHGYAHEEFLLLRIHDLLTPETATKAPGMITEIFDRGEPVSFEELHVRKDGTTFPMLVNLRETRWNGRRVLISVDSDLTGQKKTEQALMRTEKLESLGILAAGIAHDFNNLLNGIFGYIDLARISASDPKTKITLDKAFGIFDTAKELSSQLLTYSKGGAPSLHPLDVSLLLKTAVAVALKGTSIGLNIAIAPDLAACTADTEQLSQVFRHIVRNAAEAMPAGGTIDISAVNIQPQSDPGAPSLHRPYIRIIFTDYGSGILPEHLSHVLDPFFSTKPSHNGLGLTTAYMIIKRHYGNLSIESKPDSGTTVIVYLPAH